MKPKPRNTKHKNDADNDSPPPSPSKNGRNLYDLLHDLLDDLDSRFKFALCVVALTLATVAYTYTHLPR